MSTDLNALFELTDRVEAAIGAGDWQRANELESERRAELERLVRLHGDPADRAPVLNAAQSRTHRLIGLVEHHRRRVLREAATIRTGHAAAVRYVEVRGDDSKTG
jgi:hypothetical protein